MTKRITASLLLAAALLSSGTAGAATQLSADAGEIRDIKWATGTTLYAASQGGGVFKSTNSGANWGATGLTGVYAWSIAVSPLDFNRIYAATDTGLYRSTNAGASWTQLTYDPTRAVGIDSGSAGTDTVLIGVTGVGILRSTDNGATFARHNTGLDSFDVTKIVYAGSGVAYALLNCNVEDGVAPLAEGNWGGIFRATNANAAAGAITWTSFNNGGAGGALPSKCVRALDAAGATVYAGVQDPFTGGGLIYKSTGAGWDAGNNLFGIESISIDRTSVNTIHVGTRAIGLWASANGGTSYSQKSDPTPAHNQEAWTRVYAVESIPGVPNTVMIAAKGRGILRTTVYSSNPTVTNNYWTAGAGVRADRVRALSNHETAMASRYWLALENGGVMRSDNSGASWSQAIAGLDFGGAAGCCDMLLSATALAADPGNVGQVLVGTRGGGFLQWDNAQSKWVTAGVPASLVNNGSDFKPQSIIMPSTNTIFLTLFDGVSGGTAGGLLRSSTGVAGLTQTQYPDTLTSCSAATTATGSAFKVVKASGNVAYLLRYDAPPYRSADNFTSATATCPAIPHTGYERIAFYDIAPHPGVPTWLVAATSKGVFRSTNSGSDWVRLDVNGLQSTVLSGMAYIGANLFAIDRGGRFYCSVDDGVNWSNVSLGGLPPVAFREIKVMNNQIHILTDGGGVYTGFASTCP